MVNDLSGIDELELMPLGGGYMVRRERLMNELIAKGRKAGIVVLYAPDGFGKTSVLLQYTHEVKCDARSRADYRGRSCHWARGVYAARGGYRRTQRQTALSYRD